MYKTIKASKTIIKTNNTMLGERLETKVRRITTNKEPIKDGAPIIYTERKDGVLPEYDIRTDRFEIAVEAMDRVAGAHHAKRQEKLTPKEEPTPANPTGTTDKGPSTNGGQESGA